MFYFFIGAMLAFLTLLSLGQAQQIRRLQTRQASISATLNEQALQIERNAVKFRELAKLAEKYTNEVSPPRTVHGPLRKKVWMSGGRSN